MKSIIHHSLILSLSLAASAAHAATVFTDTFDTGTGSWYKASTSGTLTNSSGRLSWVENGSNMAEVIGRSFAAQTLTVGQQIRVTFDFSWSAGSGNIFRVGLFDVTNPIAADNWSDSNAIGAWAGYYTFVRDASGTGNIARRENNGSASATVGPTNGGGTVTQIGSNTTNFDIDDNDTVTYQGMFEVDYVSATQVNTLFTLMEGATTRFSVAGSQTSGSLVTTFDSVVFKTGANGPTSYLDNVQLVIIPEPSAALLGGLGALCLLRRRR
jgi:hypothetical protein